MRTALALTAATTAALVVGIAPQAAAAAPTLTSHSSAFGTLATEDVYVFADGYAYSGRTHGALEVFTGTLECFQPEPHGFSFTSSGTTGASLAGTGDLECWDFATESAVTATVTADLSWAPSGDTTTSRFVSRFHRCVSTREVAPAALTGTVRVVVPERGLDVTVTADAERPSELATQQDRCITPGR